MRIAQFAKLSAVVAVSSLGLAACASPLPVGGIYTGVTMPVAAGESGAGSKVGTSQCTTVLGLVATGDCSIEAAKQNGGIHTIRYVDWEAKSILGIGTYTTKVHGD